MWSALVIRLGAMGDVIHALPAAATLRRALGDAGSLTWIIEPRWAPLLDGNPYVDHVLTLDRSGWGSLSRSISALRRRRFDLVVDLQGLIKSALVARAARADEVAGFHRSQARERAAAWAYSKQIRTESVHVVDRYLDVAVGAAGGQAVREFPIPPGRPEGELPEGPFVLASPAAGWRAKEWPLTYWAALAANLREAGFTLVVNGPMSAVAELQAIEGAWVHLSSLAGLIDATRRAVAVVGVDSGPLHLAGALGKPGVAIFGPTDPARNGPPGDSISVLRSAGAATNYRRGNEHDPGMLAIRAEHVLAALSARIAAGAGARGGRS